MIRRIAAVVLGIVVAGGIVAAVEGIGHTVYPLPPGIDYKDPVQFETYVAGLSVGAFLFVLAAWNLGTFGGGLLACFVAREKPYIYATIIGAFVLAATVANLIMIPHPRWVAITAVTSIAIVTSVTGIVAAARIISPMD